MAQNSAAKDYSCLLALICVLLPVRARPAIAQNITPARDGTGTVINNQGQRFDITGGTTSGNGANLFHSFQQFNLDPGQRANFVSAPNIQNILGRVTGGNASIINGLITVTGGNSNLYLMNPVGVIFGPSARLDVPASFSVTTATGIGFGNNWFNAIGSNNYQNLVGTPSGYRFDVSQPGAIVNTGNLELAPGQDLTITGGTVINTGELSTPGGNVTIAAVEGGDVVRISQPGHILNLEISRLDPEHRRTGILPVSELPALLTEGNFNSHATGLTVGESGEVVLSRNPVSSRNRVSGGVTESRNPVSLRNRVSVEVSGEPGTVITSGNIDTSSSDIGGEVNILGSRVGILNAKINADGTNGGGSVFIGGDVRGGDRLPASQQTVINNSAISANALLNGNGGEVIIWSDGTTIFNGNISATGGEYSGDGGFVEVSGKERLFVNGNINVGAANGETGNILFDPRNILIDEREGLSEEGEDENGDVTITPTQLEELEGNVTLQADNDITVNQEINTSESVELKAGRSINLNADIDTSTGNGNVTLRANDEGVGVADRRGRASINQAEGTAINAGSGDIDIEFGALGNTGDISLANLTTAGTVRVNAGSGNILRVGESSISAGSASFETFGEGGIGSAEMPLRLDVGNLEALAGGGGAFFDVLTGVTVGGVRNDFTGIVTTGGGDVELSAGDRVVVSEGISTAGGGDIGLSAGGNLTVSQGISTDGGGDIGLSAGGNLTVEADISTSVNSGDAGNISLDSGGTIDIATATVSARADEGAGGDVTLEAVGDVETGDINSGGGASGGAIDITSTEGGINTTGGTLTSGGRFREPGSDPSPPSFLDNTGGDATLSAAGDINTSRIESDARKSGGDISITSREGGINTTGSYGGLMSGGFSTEEGGDVTLTAAGDIVNTGGIDSGGNTLGGNITINSSKGGITLFDSDINTYNLNSSSGGTAGDIQLQAENSISTRINASGGQGGGNITLTSNSGDIITPELNAASDNGNDGEIIITTRGGNISVGTINLTIEDGGSDNPFDNNEGDSEENTVADADTVNSRTGEVSLQAHNDITINEAIETADVSSLELTAGRNINVNADIDTSAGNGNITLEANSQGANLDLREAGPGNVNMAAGTTVSAGSGEIVIRLGSGEIGNINLANLTTTGTITVNASGGDILRVGENSLITAGGAAFLTSDNGGIGTLEMPLRLDADNLEVLAGSGGAFFEALTGVTVGGVRDELTGISTQGGDLELKVAGDIAVAEDISTSSGEGGNITLESGGAINTTAATLESAGGDMTLEAVGDIEIVSIKSSSPISGGDISITTSAGDINADNLDSGGGFRTGTGGDVTLEGDGDINVGSIRAYSGRSGGAITITSNEGGINAGDIRSGSGNTEEVGGDVTLTAVGDINAGGVSSWSSTLSGAISITSSKGGISIESTLYSGSSSTEAGGDVTISAVGDIRTAGINSSGQTSGGAISITSSEGGINTIEGILRSVSLSAEGGDVVLSAVGDINTAGIQSSGSTSGGAISITSSEGGINTARGDFNDLNTSSSEGIAGNVRLQAENSVTTTNINASGRQQGGNIALTSNAGDVVTQALDITSANGNEGKITIDTNTGSIEVGTINLTIEEGGTDNPFNDGDSQENTTADADTVNSQTGEVSLQAHNDITINEAIETAEVSSLELTAGRNININADIDTSAGNGNISLEANSQSVNPDLREAGPGNVNMAAGTTINAGSGEIVIKLGATERGEIGEVGNINLANLTTTGTITVNASGGDILRVGENSLISAGRAAFLTSGSGGIGTQPMPLRLSANNLEATAGSGGAFFDVPAEITLGGASRELEGITTQGGDVELEVAGDVTVTEGISTYVSTGDAGNITLNSSGAINTTGTQLVSTATEGAGGDVTLEAVGDIDTDSIYSHGSTSGGAIAITSRNGSIKTREQEFARLRSAGFSETETGGDVTLTAAGDIETGDIWTAGSVSGGAISINSTNGGINTVRGELNTRAEGTAGNVNLTAERNIITGNINATGSQQSGNITIESSFGDVDTSNGQLEVDSENGTDGKIEIAAFGGSISAGDFGGSRNLTIAPDGQGDPQGNNEPGSSITSDADSINSRRGEVKLQAHNDVTINEPIEASEISDLQIGAGRNIKVNADIDTSGGNGNITLQANDAGANPDYRRPGSGNVTMAPGTTLDAGSGNIFILLGGFGGDPANIGNITLGNLNTTGSVTVSARSGNIFRASPNSLVTAGSALFMTSRSGGIGFPTEPLRVRVNNLGATAGSGGAFFRSPTQGLTITGITTSGGGDVEVKANGDITVTTPISTATASESDFPTDTTPGDAGNITLVTEGDGNIDTSAARLDASVSSYRDNGGTVMLEAGGNITTGDVSTTVGSSSGYSTATFGIAGDITLNSGGNIDTTAGAIDSFSRFGDSGDITFRGDGNITTGGLNSYTTGGRNPKVGNITLESGGNIDTSRGRINSYSGSGNGGNVELTTRGNGDIRTGNIYASARFGDRGGNITITSGGNIDTTAGSLESSVGSDTGDGGNISLNANGDISTGDIRTFASGTGQGGNVSIEAGGNVNTTDGNILSASVEGDTGEISISAGGDVRTRDIDLASGFEVEETEDPETGEDIIVIVEFEPVRGVAGDINIASTNGSIDTSAGELDSRSPDGSGNITLNAPGNIGTAQLTASALNRETPTTGGDIVITSGRGKIDATASIETFSERGTAGSVTLTAEGGISTETILSQGIERGGNVSITSTAGEINSTGNIDSFSEQGIGGDVTVNAPESINLEDVSSYGLTESGDLLIESLRARVEAGNVITQASEGDSGSIRINGEEVGTGNLSSIGTARAGGISVEATDGSIKTYDIEIRSDGTAGALTLRATEDITTENLEVEAGEGDANIDLKAGGDIATEDQLAIARDGNATINNVAGGDIAVGDQTAISEGGNALINNDAGGNLTTGEQTAIASDGSAEISNEAEGSINTGNVSANSTTAIANAQTLALLEESRNQEFADYLGLDLSFDQSAIKNVREVLADMAEQTGHNSAVVYISLYAEEIQLILYTPEGEPILKTIPGVKREEVIETVQKFRSNIATSLRFQNLKTYLPPAQQLYQWLIAPIAAELETANIDTLLFSMDEGLRGLPVAALHDGEQFLIEQYSLSMIPSISLIDSRYSSVKGTTVLAMGASEFTELNPLPAVPVELETITTELWQGNALIDEEFTVSNLIAQREQQTYPIIHLATHGEFKPGDAGNSYIQFWGEEKLPLDRVRELGLNNPPVELLVLSACRTAVGDANAELGFAGLAVAAGVKSAVASLWYVSDEGTLGLMTEFYHHLDGVTIKAEALRQAQLAMLRGEVEVAEGQLRGSGSRGAVSLPQGLAHIQNNNLSHPYYWSGFMTIGSPW